MSAREVLREALADTDDAAEAKPKHILLREWAVHGNGGHYRSRALDGYPRAITGRTDNHPDSAGRLWFVHTSQIVSVRGRIVTTLTGNVYELVGEPHPKYAEAVPDWALALAEARHG